MIYAFLLLVFFLVSVAVVVALAPESPPSSASRTSGDRSAANLCESVMQFLASNLPITGADVASICWNGCAMKTPWSLNHSLKGRENFVSIFFLSGVVMVTVMLYTGSFFFVVVEIETLWSQLLVLLCQPGLGRVLVASCSTFSPVGVVPSYIMDFSLSSVKAVSARLRDA